MPPADHSLTQQILSVASISLMLSLFAFYYTNNNDRPTLQLRFTFLQPRIIVMGEPSTNYFVYLVQPLIFTLYTSKDLYQFPAYLHYIVVRQFNSRCLYRDSSDMRQVVRDTHVHAHDDAVDAKYSQEQDYQSENNKYTVQIISQSSGP